MSTKELDSLTEEQRTEILIREMERELSLFRMASTLLLIIVLLLSFSLAISLKLCS